ncbi:MAG: aspartate aminotransferase family protein [Candidatus Meridianibacter frigidus]|nr:MAG: aspartate aminotransferase family protein [Candidatus Eremiobacteraeota bacterium]
MNGEEFENIRGPVPGERTAQLSSVLRAYESRGVTYLGADFPVFWQSAHGVHVDDVDGNRYLDLTSAFGVANSGHGNPRVAGAIARQAGNLMHAMGDVHPTQGRAQLLQRLAEITPGDLCKTYLCSTGAEAVETALKTAMLATGKSAFASFHGAYHGLSFGALEVCGIPKFRAPFDSMLAKRTLFLDYPHGSCDFEHNGARTIRERLEMRDDIAALIVEPIQARAGIIVPPEGFLSALRALCTGLGIVLIFDEIYTGFGRTGKLFAAEHEHVVPDVMCIGKAMANGFPISAMTAKAAVMDAWQPSQGEALHTSTYLGNPMGCAAALANIEEIHRLELVSRAHELGRELGERLKALRRDPNVADVRGRGLMWGIEFRDARTCERIVRRALRKGLILLQSGEEGEVLSLTPPLVISQDQLNHGIEIIEELLATPVSP